MNLTAIVTASGIKVDGGKLVFHVNGKDINATSDVNGVYSTYYPVDFIGTQTVSDKYTNCDKTSTTNINIISIGTLKDLVDSIIIL